MPSVLTLTSINMVTLQILTVCLRWCVAELSGDGTLPQERAQADVIP